LPVSQEKVNEDELQDALSASKAHYDLLFNNVNDLIIVHDLDGRILEANQVTSRVLGYTQDELVKMSISDLQWSGEDEFHKHVGTLFSTGQIATKPIAHKTKDGRAILLEIRAGMSRHNGKDIIFSICRDVTEREKEEKRLIQSEAKFKAAFDMAATGMIMETMDGRILKVNEAFCEMIGCRMEELAGKSIFDITHPDDVGASKLILKNFDPPGSRTLHLEKRYLKKGGNVLWGLVGITKIMDVEGSPPYLLSQIQDITDRKRMEDLLKKHSEHLEELVQERTEQLRRSERLSTIGQTAAAVGHDLKSPLQTFNNTLYIMKRTLASQSLAEADRERMDSCFAMAHSQIRYMNDLILDLQHMAKDIKPAPVETQFKKFMDSIFSNFEIPPSTKLELKADGTAFIDPFLMERVMINLSNNAVQAMPKGGVLTVEASSVDDAFLIRVSDTGVGISKENMGKLFQPLFTTKSRGTGLGLVIVKRIVEAHRGTIEVESVPDKGTTFSIKLPGKPPQI